MTKKEFGYFEGSPFERVVGDRGQRYEINFQHKQTGKVDPIGWSNNPDGFAEALRLDPKYRNTHERVVIDREVKP